MGSRLETLRLEVDKLIKEYQPRRDNYFFSHLYGVSHFCTLLAIRRNLNPEIAAAAGMLHDISQITTGVIDNHAIIGAKQAENILTNFKLYSDDEIALISSAISKHSDKNVIDGPLDELLKDADVMDHGFHDTSVPVSDKEKERYKCLLAELGCTSTDSDTQSRENFSIPGVGGIITRDINNIEHILLQIRCKPNAQGENGLLEIPAGKIRAFENIFDTLRREIKEETGLEITDIFGENKCPVYEENNYKVINFMPFSCAQNTEGSYPIMVFVFICKATGNLLPFSDESRDYKWTPVLKIKKMLAESPELFYPMHIDTLRKYAKTAE